MGQDGKSFTSPNGLVARDAFGLGLKYYNGDYEGAGGSDLFLANSNTTSNSLYNGNIAQMSTAMLKGDETKADVLRRDYVYDKLNRIRQANTLLKDLGHANHSWAATTSSNVYKEEFEYDQVGNIKHAKRFGTDAATPMDDISYNYLLYNASPDSWNGKIQNNQLQSVNENANPSTSVYGDENYPNSTQSATNFQYDPIGNLKQDLANNIAAINWNVYGKLKSVIKNNSSADQRIYYDPMGQRSIKAIAPHGSTDSTYEYYLRDAQGNLMASYTASKADDAWKLALKERHLYGSSRLGILRKNQDIILAESSNYPINLPTVQSTNTNSYSFPLYDSGFELPTLNYPLLPATSAFYQRAHGYRDYELTNHLGNVMVVLSDRKYPIQGTSTTGSIAFYQPDVRSSKDYYAFGGLMPGRKWDDIPNSLGSYKFGINGQLKDNEIYGEGNAFSAEFWEYDTRLGRRWNVDPIFKEWESSYAVFGNNPIWLSDALGLDTLPTTGTTPPTASSGDLWERDLPDGSCFYYEKCGNGNWEGLGGEGFNLPEIQVEEKRTTENNQIRTCVEDEVRFRPEFEMEGEYSIGAQFGYFINDYGCKANFGSLKLIGLKVNDQPNMNNVSEYYLMGKDGKAEMNFELAGGYGASAGSIKMSLLKEKSRDTRKQMEYEVYVEILKYKITDQYISGKLYCRKEQIGLGLTVSPACVLGFDGSIFLGLQSSFTFFEDKKLNFIEDETECK